MAYDGYNSVAFPMFTEQVVSDNTTYYTDIQSIDSFDKVNLHITSSGTVDGTFVLQTRSRPAPEVGVWVDQDDGYWFNESTTISGAQGNGDKQNDSIHLTNVDSAQLRLKMDIISGGTVGVWATLK